MKVSYWDYLKTLDVSVLVAEIIFSELVLKYPLKTISEVAETTSGGTPLRNNQEYYGGIIPWLKSGELNDGYIEKAEEYITEQGLKNSSAKVFPSGTLLLAMYGATVGKTGITSIDTATNQAVCAIFPKDAIRRDYLYWFFKQHRYKYIEQSKGGAQPNISQTVINHTSVPLPELEIQDKLVSILQTIQNNNILDLTEIPSEYRTNVNKVFHTKSIASKIEKEIESQQRNVKLLRQQILQDAVQGKLVPQDPNDEPASKLLERLKAEKEELIKQKKIKKEKPLTIIKPEEKQLDIPDSWVWCRLSEITEITGGGTPSMNNSEYWNGSIPWISPKDMCANEINDSEMKITREGLDNSAARLIPQGSLLIVGRSGILKRKLPVAINLIPCAVNQDMKVLIPHFHSMNLYLQLILFGMEKWILKRLVKFGMTVHSLRYDEFALMPIPLPPLSEQHRIVEKINQLMQYCDELEKTIRQNQSYTQELLQVVLKEALAFKKSN